MAGYICWDYQCLSCEHTEPLTVDRNDVPNTTECTKCGGATRRIYAHIGVSVHSIPEGSGNANRFAEVKEAEKLRRQAKWEKNKTEKKRMIQEVANITKIKE